MQMHDEVTHLRIVDGLLRLCLPGIIGAGIIRIDADDVDLIELELDAVDAFKLAAEDEVGELLVRHHRLPDQANSSACWRKSFSIVSCRSTPAASRAP